MRLDLLRHGITALNEGHRFNGWRDDGLTPAQCESLARVRFEWRHYDVVYCSPLVRCVETARCLGVKSYRTDQRIAERNLGIFEGLTPEECRARHEQHFLRFLEFDADYRIPEGESRAENLARVFDWLQDARRFERVLAITHGGTIDFLFRMATGHSLHGGTEIFSGANAAISELEIDWPSVRLVEFARAL
jgi:broad specificity phosphatase PhoE